YQQQAGFSSSNLRASYTIGRIVNSLREDDDLYELLTSKLLLQSWRSQEERAAGARLLLACAMSFV
ncbi:unnamed protein product, partial [Closterium sp. NIES-53]